MCHVKSDQNRTSGLKQTFNFGQRMLTNHNTSTVFCFVLFFCELKRRYSKKVWQKVLMREHLSVVNQQNYDWQQRLTFTTALAYRDYYLYTSSSLMSENTRRAVPTHKCCVLNVNSKVKRYVVSFFLLHRQHVERVAAQCLFWFFYSLVREKKDKIKIK